MTTLLGECGPACGHEEHGWLVCQRRRKSTILRASICHARASWPIIIESAGFLFFFFSHVTVVFFVLFVSRPVLQANRSWLMDSTWFNSLAPRYFERCCSVSMGLLYVDNRTCTRMKNCWCTLEIVVPSVKDYRVTVRLHVFFFNCSRVTFIFENHENSTFFTN